MIDGSGWLGGNFLGTFTWASKPASAALGQYIIVSDLGISGYRADWVGTKWVLGIFSQIQSGQRLIIPSLAAANAAAYSQTNNTVTVNNVAHGILAAENGASIYLVQGTILTGVAPTALNNWFTNFQWVGVNSFTCQATNSQSATGNFNSNTAETVFTPLTTALPGHVLGPNGTIESIIGFTSSGVASSTSVLNFYYDSLAYSVFQLPVFLDGRAFSLLQNANNESVQNVIDSGTLGSAAYGFSRQNSYSQHVNGAIDSTVAKNISFSGQVTTAGSYLAIKQAKVVVSPA